MELKNITKSNSHFFKSAIAASFPLVHSPFLALELSVDEMSHVDVESGGHQRSVTGSDVSAGDSVYFSDGDEDSCYSQFFSPNGGSYDEYMFALGFAGILSASQRASAAAVDSPVKVEIGTGVTEITVDLGKIERDCRICHLGLESNSRSSGVPIELGCSCKDDLAVAHKHCAETWFKIKGNKTCEICHSVARNVLGVDQIEVMDRTNVAGNASIAAAPVSPAERPRLWSGRRFLVFLLTCLVMAFVVSWLFHFDAPS